MGAYMGKMFGLGRQEMLAGESRIGPEGEWRRGEMAERVRGCEGWKEECWWKSECMTE